MKDWKQQLRKAKRALFDTKSNQSPPEKPLATDFVPPESWLNSDPGSQDIGHPSSHGASKADIRREPRSAGRPIEDGTASMAIGDPAGGNDTDVQDRSNVSQSSDVPGTLESPQVPTKPSPQPQIFRPHIDAGRRLSMPDWSDGGRGLNPPDHQGGRALPVRVGIDFGTAFSKVAIRAGIDQVLVDWSAVTGDQSRTGRHVMPGFVYRSPSGEYGWTGAGEFEALGNLKLPAIDMAGSERCPSPTLAFLALVIRHSRAFLYRHPDVGRKLNGRSLRWELNIGCPTEPHENPDVVEAFRRIARTAWRLAGDGDLTDAYIAAVWDDQERDTGLEANPGVIPEFVAQIAGYLRSPQVSEGLHALIDIGAATLDVATFNVVLQGDTDSTPRIPIFFSAVRPLGTHFLYQDRHTCLGLELTWDDGMPVESAEVFGLRHGLPSTDIEVADADFMSRTAKVIATVIDGTRTNSRGDPRSAAWTDGLPIFVTGGGAGCQLYRHAIATVEDEVRRTSGNPKFRFLELDPVASDFQSVSAETVGRASVAIGLTEDADSIARVVPHRDIKPISYVERERADHNQLYGDR